MLSVAGLLIQWLLCTAVNEDYRFDPLVVSFGEPGVTTSQSDLEGSLSTVAQIEIVDDEILDSNTEEILVLLLTGGIPDTLRITIVDDESKSVLQPSCTVFMCASHRGHYWV